MTLRVACSTCLRTHTTTQIVLKRVGGGWLQPYVDCAKCGPTFAIVTADMERRETP